MIDFLRLIGLHNNKEKCLICDKKAGKDAAVVNFKHQDGISQAFVCKKCADQMDKSKLDDDYEHL